MLKTGVQHLSDMVIGEGVIYRFSVPSKLHELCLAEGGKLMRNGGLGHVEDVGDVADTKLVLLQRPDDAHAGGVAQHLEKGGDLCEIGVGQHFCGDTTHGCLMHHTAIAGKRIFRHVQSPFRLNHCSTVL